ncbi:MAG: uncharacterized protein QOD00_2616 [Blastocatellia bacterium]|jgi:uncharacterized membrane protein (UPF0182 family)|nr:uncharacterized protein [Blastocatellia bacterium]
MSKHISPDSDDVVIDIGPAQRGRHWGRWALAAVALLVFALFRSLSIYLSALWFDSLGYASVYWYMFRLKLMLFVGFALLTFLILRGAFWLIERALSSYALERRVVTFNNQQFNISPARILRPLSWIVSGVVALLFGLGMLASWRRFALYLHQTPTGDPDPIFNKPVGFYLFTLPVHQLLSWWLTVLAFITLAGAALYVVGTLSSSTKKTTFTDAAQRKTRYAVISCALAGYLLMLAWRFYLSRFPYLWEDHQIFTGVNYTEANYVLPGLTFVSIALIIAALIAVINAFTERRLRMLLFAVALPLVVYVVAVGLIPGYVTSFIVKPNELGRETPYIEHNINWTRRAYKLDQIEMRDFEADTSSQGFDLNGNRATFDNIRLWDWRALQDTLRQLQEIRPYYDFPDVDVDRYTIGGQRRQMMLAAREIDIEKLPNESRNWINEKLVYTHGYGITMNTSNGFDAEGMPLFQLSNMPIESSAPEIKVTRPEIYFGQKTDTDVYVKTKQKEFNYPQGEANNYTTYEGTGGIRIGNSMRRLLLGWALNDLSKLPFSDDVTSESRVLIHRNIIDRIESLAPFLTYDPDPYIVVSDDGRLYWMIDAFTESASYPYARHENAGKSVVNYIRNSVKVTVDAYNGDVNFYVFDAADPLIKTYRATFPSLFKDASQMPTDLHAHVRYPETLIKTQGDVYSLYHTQNTKVFFQREDVWSVASQVSLGQNNEHKTEPLEPYFVLMQLPGEAVANEFVQILPFTPANRNNMIGWMAGRSDGDAYGSMLVYNFPKSRLIDGPLQIEARIDQNAQLSSQFTLWNQQGSHVRRGNLLVIPIGRSLLYVEPIYLQAERSPMPELRLVVLATQERLGYGLTFGEALSSLLGQSGPTAAPDKTEQSKAQQQPQAQQPGSTTQPAPSASPAPQTTEQLINRASQEFDDYQRLTKEGKYGEAGQRLEQLKATLEELKKQQNQ